VILRAIILIENKGCDLGKARLELFPTIGQTIDHEVTGDFRAGKIEKEFFGRRQVNAKRGYFHRCFLLKVMVESLNRDPIEAIPRKAPQPKGGFGIAREAEDGRIRIGRLIHLTHRFKNGVGGRYFFHWLAFFTRLSL
jgi:hypothetical protein